MQDLFSTQGYWENNEVVIICFQQGEESKKYNLRNISRLNYTDNIISQLHQREIGKGGRGNKKWSINKQKKNR